MSMEIDFPVRFVLPSAEALCMIGTSLLSDTPTGTKSNKYRTLLTCPCIKPAGIATWPTDCQAYRTGVNRYSTAEGPYLGTSTAS